MEAQDGVIECEEVQSCSKSITHMQKSAQLNEFALK